MASWHDDNGGRDLRPLPFFLYLLALGIAVVLVAGASNARGGPADRCPPAGHTTAGDACLPCTPTECRPAAPAACVTVSISRGTDYLEATGRVTFRQTGEGYDYIELDGGRVKVNTIRPPLEVRPAARCRP